MANDPTAPVEQGTLRGEYTVGVDDSRLLEQLAQFAERASPDAARAALIFMGWVIRDAHRRHERSGP